jgi:glycosyltransferase involved in cell wall biosynthesis
LPNAFSPHCFSFESVRDRTLLFRIYRLTEQWLGRLTNCLVCVAATERELALEYRIVAPERTVVIPCFADTAQWVPREACAELKTALGIPAANKVVGTISRFYRQKAPVDFAKTAEALLRKRPDVSFLFIGDDGPLHREFHEYLLAKNLLGHVIFHPWVECGEKLRGLVSIFNVFASNSLWEGAPIAVIEAMSMAKPIAATDIPGTRAMLYQPECGLLSPVGRPDLMAPNILRLLDCPELAGRLGENGRRRAQAEFSLDSAEQQHKELYRKLASTIRTK